MSYSDPRYMRIKTRLRDLEAELSKAGFRGQISKITEIQEEIDELYKELGPSCVQKGTPVQVLKTTLKGPNPSRLRVRAQSVTGRIFKPRRGKNV